LTVNVYSMFEGRIKPFDILLPGNLDIVEINDKRGISDLDKNGVLILWGGADIHPSFYNRETIYSVDKNRPVSFRDQIEAKHFAMAQEEGIPTIGICRGAQFLCALNGGLLIQDVTGHNRGDHLVETAADGRFSVSSTHHQMMYPWNVEHHLLAWSSKQLSEHYFGLDDSELEAIPVDNQGGFIEPEIVWFPKTRSLAIQGHPEYKGIDHMFNRFVSSLVNQFIKPHLKS